MTTSANPIATSPVRLAFSFSPSTTTPSTAATTGCDICRAGIDAVSGPARNANWPQTKPPATASKQAYNSGLCVTGRPASPSLATTSLVSTANTPHRDPATNAYDVAATTPPRVWPTTRYPMRIGPNTAATMPQVCSGALVRPASG